jgi:hypothetical protein
MYLRVFLSIFNDLISFITFTRGSDSYDIGECRVDVFIHDFGCHHLFTMLDRHFRFSDEGIFTTDVLLWIYIWYMDHLDTTISVRE